MLLCVLDGVDRNWNDKQRQQRNEKGGERKGKRAAHRVAEQGVGHFVAEDDAEFVLRVARGQHAGEDENVARLEHTQFHSTSSVGSVSKVTKKDDNKAETTGRTKALRWSLSSMTVMVQFLV